jgi:hypothetical protein
VLRTGEDCIENGCIFRKTIHGGRCASFRYTGNRIGLLDFVCAIADTWVVQDAVKRRSVPLFLEWDPEKEGIADIYIPIE